jgi:ABC-type glycerol-3-phosphate transport system substrate-binding protein
MVKILDPVWIGQKKPEQAMDELQALWQKHLDKG